VETFSKISPLEVCDAHPDNFEGKFCDLTSGNNGNANFRMVNDLQPEIHQQACIHVPQATCGKYLAQLTVKNAPVGRSLRLMSDSIRK
jgi:hypothetical protein